MTIDELLKKASPRPWKLVRPIGTKMTVVFLDFFLIVGFIIGRDR